MNGFRNFAINSCFLIGQCPRWIMFLFRVPLCLSSSLQWNSRRSTVWSPCLQTHVALTNSLNRWRQALIFPCPVVTAAILGVTLIFMLSLSWIVENNSLVIAAFVYVCMYIHMYVCVCTYVCVYVCVDVVIYV